MIKLEAFVKTVQLSLAWYLSQYVFLNRQLRTFVEIFFFLNLIYSSLYPFLFVCLFSHQVMSDSLRSHGLQHASLPCPSLSPGVCSNSCSSSWRYHSTIIFYDTPSPPALNHSQHQGLFQRFGSLHQVAKVLELQLQNHSFQ